MDSYGVYTSIPHEVGVCFWIFLDDGMLAIGSDHPGKFLDVRIGIGEIWQ